MTRTFSIFSTSQGEVDIAVDLIVSFRDALATEGGRTTISMLDGKHVTVNETKDQIRTMIARGADT